MQREDRLSVELELALVDGSCQTGNPPGRYRREWGVILSQIFEVHPIPSRLLCGITRRIGGAQHGRNSSHLRRDRNQSNAGTEEE